MASTGALATRRAGVDALPWVALRRFSGRLLQCPQVEGGDGLEQALEGEGAHRIGVDQGLDGARDPGGHEDLPSLRLRAEASGEVGDGADGAVVPAPLE